jgi:hypothetical protein
MPYAVDAFGQFGSLVYTVFARYENTGIGDQSEEADIIAEFLRRNETLAQYVRELAERVRRVASMSKACLDEGFNLAILHQPGSADVAHEVEVVRKDYHRKKLLQHEMLYDQLVYPLIFWSGTGGCGVSVGSRPQGATTVIRKCAMALIMQPRGHFLHALSTLREEFICAVEDRLINLNIKFLIGAQRAMAREDEVRGDADVVEKEYGLRTFIPASVLGTDQYWSGVANKCFAISSQLGAPTFFLTFTMNPYWPEFVALRRGKEAYSDSAMMAIVFKERLGELMRTIKSSRVLGDVKGYVWRVEYQSRGLPHAHILLWTDFETEDLHAVEEVINVRYPKRSPFLLEDSKVDDWRELIDAYQIHHHSSRCTLPDGSCRYGYQQPPCAETVIRRRRYQFARDEDEGWIVPHNLFLLAIFRSHQCLEVIHSE